EILRDGRPGLGSAKVPPRRVGDGSQGTNSARACKSCSPTVRSNWGAICEFGGPTHLVGRSPQTTRYGAGDRTSRTGHSHLLTERAIDRACRATHGFRHSSEICANRGCSRPVPPCSWACSLVLLLLERISITIMITIMIRKTRRRRGGPPSCAIVAAGRGSGGEGRRGGREGAGAPRTFESPYRLGDSSDPGSQPLYRAFPRGSAPRSFPRGNDFDWSSGGLRPGGQELGEVLPGCHLRI